MFLYYIILLFLCWPNARGSDNAESQDETIFDQLATASENIRTLAKTVPPSIDTSIDYENSNGFIPMTPSTTITQHYQQHVEFIAATTLKPKNVYDVHDDQENSSTSAELNLNVNRNIQKDREKKFENDLVYSPEARIFLDLPHSGTNRRSFEFQDDQNTFELLKVHNDTPAIANYNDFYENIADLNEPDNTETDNSSINESKSNRRKRINSYATSYGTVNLQSAKTEENIYDRYHSYGATKDEKRTIQKPEKVTSNYYQRNTVNYNGHGQSTTKQKTIESSTSSRTNYEDNDSNKKNGNYHDSSSSSSNLSKNRHKFMKPVVVVDPNHYKIELNFNRQSSNSESPVTTDNHLKNSDSIIAESSNVYDRYHQEARGRSYNRDDSNDDSNDSLDYMDYIEKPRRINKNKRRPYNVESSRRLPKEHRTVTEDSMETESFRKRPSSTRSKPYRQRGQSTAWIDDDRNRNENDSTEERVQESRMRASQMKHPKSQKQENVKSTSSSGWRQLGPNIEISHSNGIEISPTDKSNLVIPVGLMSIANFDHATALGNSQGFDVSNVVYQNFVTPTPIGTVSTANTPLLGSHQSTVGQNIVTASNVPRTLTNLPNIQNVGIPTAIPDIIVGQNSFQNPTHTVLVPHQTNFPNKITSNSNAQYVSSTITPIFAVTTRLNPTLQNVRFQNLPNNVTPRPAFATTSPTSNLQQGLNQMQQGISHLFVPQSTIQTLPNLVQAPAQANSEYNIQVNPHGLQGQNVISQGSFQIPNYPVHTTTTPSPQFTPITRVNLITADSQSKKTFIPASGGNILASASFSVGQNSQVQSNDNNYASQTNLRPISQENSYRVIKDDNNMSKTKTYLQTASLVPFYHPVPPLDGVSLNQQASQNVQNMNFFLPRLQEQNAQYQNILHQLQLQLQQAQAIRNNKYTNHPYQTSDSVGSQTISSVNVINTPQDNNFAHLPKVGAKNVEIMNPNIRPSPVDTTIIHPLQTLHYPIITTPIPILTSTPISLITPTSSYIDSLTEIGTKSNHPNSSTMDMKTSQNQERPIFNPINFVPNTDVIKDQNVLNSKLQNHESLQQPLNLVPMIPEGNFYKPTFAAQSELLTKPKLTTDLEKYAEEMFKESLRTIYNSQKWNNDRKVQSSNNQTNIEPKDIAALKNELMRLKETWPDIRQNKEILEAYQSENKIRTTEENKLTNPGNDQKKPDLLLATLEELLKKQPTESIHKHHGHRHKHSRKRPYTSSTKHLRDFLTPPKPNSFHPTNHFHEKPRSKKRPSSSLSRFNHHSHSHFENPRHNKQNALNIIKPVGPEASASNIDGVRVNRPSYSDFRNPTSTDDYPTFTTSAPTTDDISKFLKELRSPSSTESNKYDINHPRMHNLLALLMKNKQLPSGNKPNYFRNREQLRQFFEDEKRRLQEQFYNDTLRSYLDKNSDDVSSRMMPSSSNVGSNGAA